MDLYFWRTAGLVAVAAGQTAFVLLYCTFPWWTRFLGKALFFKALALAVLVDLAVIYRVFQFPYADQIFTSLYWVLAFGVWAQTGAFLRVRLRHRQVQAVSGNDPVPSRD